MPDRTLEDLLKQYNDMPDDEFLRLLVHDLRGPLSSMISASKLLTTLLDDETLDEAQLRQLGNILLKTTDNMRVVLEAAIAYDQVQRGESVDGNE